MKKLKYITPFLFLALLMSSCKKDDLNTYSIKDITYHFTDINNCQLNDGGTNGSSFTLSVKVDHPNYDDIYGLKIIFKQEKKKDNTLILSRDIDLSITDHEINAYRCIRFAQLNKAVYIISIVTMDGLESKPYSLDIDRPSGAN